MFICSLGGKKQLTLIKRQFFDHIQIPKYFEIIFVMSPVILYLFRSGMTSTRGWLTLWHLFTQILIERNQLTTFLPLCLVKGWPDILINKFDWIFILF
jgi:hypothetical protein